MSDNDEHWDEAMANDGDRDERFDSDEEDEFENFICGLDD